MLKKLSKYGNICVFGFETGISRVFVPLLPNDSELPRFGLRVKPSGARRAVSQCRSPDPRTCRGTRWGNDPDEARALARDALADVRKGKDPSASRAAAREGLTVADLCDDYLKAAEKGMALGKRGRPKSPLTILTDGARINGHIKPLLGTLKVQAVTRHDVARFLDAVQLANTARRSKAKRTQGRSSLAALALRRAP